MRLDVACYGDPILRRKADPIGDVTKAIRRLADDMLETMHAERGVGLAAQQVRQTVALCVIDLPPEYDRDGEDGPPFNPGIAMPLIMLNPRIVERLGGLETAEEGCLSFPGIRSPIARAGGVAVAFHDFRGEARVLNVRGFLARAIQHELDHLEGVLFVDRMPAVRRLSLGPQLKRLRRRVEEHLGSPQG